MQYLISQFAPLRVVFGGALGELGFGNLYLDFWGCKCFGLWWNVWNPHRCLWILSKEFRIRVCLKLWMLKFHDSFKNIIWLSLLLLLLMVSNSLVLFLNVVYFICGQFQESKGDKEIGDMRLKTKLLKWD